MKNKHSQHWKSEIEAAFTNQIVIPECNSGYIAKLYFVTFLSLLPVVLYLGLIAFGFLIYFIYAIKLLPGLWNPPSAVYIVFYVIALLSATFILFFLCRPFIMTSPREGYFELEAGREPHIFTFANSFAEKMGVDPVVRIKVSSEVVVDAYYESLRDFYDGRLTLKIGLPLMPTLTLVELYALIAHEYSHYALKQIKICYFILRNIRSWFYRVVNNQGDWEKKIEAIGKNESLRHIKFFTIPVSFGILFVNRLFQFFSNVLELMSNQLVFDTEFYADKIQAQIIGSEHFDRSLKHLVQIDQAYHAAIEKILSTELLPENISDLTYSLYEKNPLPSNQFIEMTRAEYFNSWHLLPPPSSRTRRVEKTSVASIFALEKSVASLFVDADIIGRAVTESVYEKYAVNVETQARTTLFDERVRPLPMSKEESLLQRFSSGLYRRDMVWVFPDVGKFACLSEEKIRPFLNKVVVSIRHSLPDFSQYVELVDEYNKLTTQYHFYQWLIKDGSKNRPDPEVISEIKISLKEFELKHKNSRASYCKFFGVRVAAAVAMGKQSKAYASATKLIAMLVKLSAIQAQVSDAKIKCSTLEKLIVRRAEGEMLHQKTISRLTRMILKVVENMELATAGLPPQLLGRVGKVDIHGTMLHLNELNGEDYEKLVADRFFELVRYYEGFNTAISAKLAQFVEMVERHKDIPPVVTVSLGGSEHAA